MHLSVLTSLHPLMRDITALTLHGACHTLSVELTAHSVILTLTTPEGDSGSEEIPLAHPCVTCSMREGILPAIIELADLGCERLLLALPAAIEALSLVPTLADIIDSEELPISLRAVAHSVDVTTACEDLLSHTLLHDKGLAVIDEDERCAGEVLMVSLGYADIIIALGEDPAGSDLVEHLRPLDTLRINTLEELTAELLFEHRHDANDAIGRIHPTSTQAWGGPTDNGVWTLDLHSERPFHPERLAQWAKELSAADICARGCFWLPSRPRQICTWEANGPSASVGQAGIWTEDPFTHLILTGNASPERQEEIAQTFQRILMTEEEMATALDWVGAADGLDTWFPADD
ncbi:GTP-binding protein [Schaalia sp. Marseille-Q2122]|uniref:GTP-binding protein n=1 Tax=Schaalia sp. Marseille-Q2122 TaxID=2736604 RepID=UPI00158AA801|nr:GTP-binding protein [Schaalia sp. Marseille-Q2122]